jgi:hypothetical protein
LNYAVYLADTNKTCNSQHRIFARLDLANLKCAITTFDL